jgi:hypothetical protein
MPARLSDALPRASTCAAAAACPAPSPCRPPARAATAPRRQAAPRPGTVTSYATPTRPGQVRVRVRVRRMQARNNSGHYPLIPAGRQTAARVRVAWVPHCYPTRYPAPRKLTEHYSNSFCDLGWSYGDSNPRPLACHEVHTQPLTSPNAA